jgi:hypothetical protein
MIQEMKRRGYPEEAIRKLVYDNPLAFWRQSVRWQEWETTEPVAGPRTVAEPHAKEALASAKR